MTSPTKNNITVIQVILDVSYFGGFAIAFWYAVVNASGLSPYILDLFNAVAMFEIAAAILFTLTTLAIFWMKLSKAKDKENIESTLTKSAYVIISTCAVIFIVFSFLVAKEFSAYWVFPAALIAFVKHFHTLLKIRLVLNGIRAALDGFILMASFILLKEALVELDLFKSVAISISMCALYFTAQAIFMLTSGVILLKYNPEQSSKNIDS